MILVVAELEAKAIIVTIPVGSRVVGEAWSVIIGGGSAFADEANPKVVVKIGQTGDKGTAEITDVM